MREGERKEEERRDDKGLREDLAVPWCLYHYLRPSKANPRIADHISRTKRLVWFCLWALWSCLPWDVEVWQ